MDWLDKMMVTAASVLLVLLLGRRAGRRVAGIVAGLPVVTGPALAWLAHDRGDAFAADAAVASVAACTMLAAFAAVHAQVARRRGVACALGSAATAAALLAQLVMLADVTLAVATPLAFAACFVVSRCMPGPCAPPVRPVAVPILVTTLVASGFSALAAAAAPWCGSAVAGLLASLPLVSATVGAMEHAKAGGVAVARFQHGYVAGLMVRNVFCASFALLAVPLGGPAAMALGACAAVFAGLLAHRSHGRRRRARDWPPVQVAQVSRGA